MKRARVSRRWRGESAGAERASQPEKGGESAGVDRASQSEWGGESAGVNRDSDPTNPTSPEIDRQKKHNTRQLEPRNPWESLGVPKLTDKKNT